MTPEEIINYHIPFTGPCAFCGNPDSRHRLFDSIVEMNNAGEQVDDIANEFDLSPGMVKAVIDRDLKNGDIREYRH